MSGLREHYTKKLKAESSNKSDCLATNLLCMEEHHEEFWKDKFKPASGFKIFSNDYVVKDFDNFKMYDTNTNKHTYHYALGKQMMCFEYNKGKEFFIQEEPEILFLLEPYTDKVWCVTKNKKGILDYVSEDKWIMQSDNKDTVTFNDLERFLNRDPIFRQNYMLVIGAVNIGDVYVMLFKGYSEMRKMINLFSRYIDDIEQEEESSDSD